MEVLKKSKASSLASLGISLFLHVALVAIFGVWSFSGEEKFNLIKIPSSISVNLGGVTARSNSKDLKQPSSAKRTSIMTDSQSARVSSSTQVNSQVSGDPQGTGTVTTGTGGSASGSGIGGAETAILTAKQKYFLEFRNLIESKKEYPTMARMRGLEGVVVISVRIKANGEVTDHKVAKESGHALLDQSALNLAKKIYSFKALPPEISGEDLKLSFPISYKLDN